jgi:hypothetical protein
MDINTLDRMVKQAANNGHAKVVDARLFMLASLIDDFEQRIVGYDRFIARGREILEMSNHQILKEWLS